MVEYGTYARFALSEHTFRTHFFETDDGSVANPDGFTVQMLRTAYSFQGNFSGEGIKIAIISAFDNVGIQENMRVFCETFGLAFPKMTVHYPFGRTDVVSRNWLIESSLDTQWSHAFAPMADIDIVFSPDSSVTSLLDCSHYAMSVLSADIICMCFGSDESARDMELCEFMGTGQGIFVSSSGDVGGRVSFPSTAPDCISVGGTSLFIRSDYKRLAETAWKNSGGGKSRVFGTPLYQKQLLGADGETEGSRCTPDVSMTADFSPGAVVYVSELGGWRTVGGTSLSAACFSGVCACIRQANPQIRTTKDMLSFLYAKAGRTEYEFPQYNYYDIIFGKSGQFTAKEGWDFCTGLGSPVIKRILQ